jgi:hypothetical protein
MFCILGEMGELEKHNHLTTIYLKVGTPNFSTTIMWTPIFEWCVWLGVIYEQTPKDTSWKEIGLRAQNVLPIRGSMVNMIRGPIWPLNEHENPHFDKESDIHMSSKVYEPNGYGYDVALLT